MCQVVGTSAGGSETGAPVPPLVSVSLVVPVSEAPEGVPLSPVGPDEGSGEAGVPVVFVPGVGC